VIALLDAQVDAPLQPYADRLWPLIRAKKHRELEGFLGERRGGPRR
jgi:hypothetical protein